MIDINLIRKKPEWVKEQVAKRNDSSPIDEIMTADMRRREILLEVEELRRQRNAASKLIGRQMGSLKKLEGELKRVKAGGSGRSLADIQAEVQKAEAAVEAAKAGPRLIGDQIAILDAELRDVEATFNEGMLWVPNMPDPSTPVGPDETYNVIHEPQGAPEPTFNFEPKPHWDLGTALDIIDFDRGVKMSGSRFYLLKSKAHVCSVL